jgi:hypothetical protein
MEIEIVTPAGRKKYLEILFHYLSKQKHHFNEWTLWINTSNQDDIRYCYNLQKTNPWIKIIHGKLIPNRGMTIHEFYPHACDPNKIYIRLDDDIVWLDDNFIKNLSQFRKNHPEYFLVYPNIVNNSIMDHINQRMGNFSNIQDIFGYNCFDKNGWNDNLIAQKKHEYFINHILTNQTCKFNFDKWILNLYERVSINCISWLGSEFAKFDGQVGRDEEHWLSEIKPRLIKKPNVIYGKPLCSHFSFQTQRQFLETSTDILNRYKNLTTYFLNTIP